MNKLPMISVIVPTYNAEKFITSAYSFVKNQKLNLPLEIIFVDNNSNDNSLQLITELAAKDRNVQAFQEKVQGAAAARNKGLKEASGDFIYFFDVDDQLFEDTIANLSQVLISYPSCEAVFGKMLKSYETVKSICRHTLRESEDIIFKEKPYWGMKWFKDLRSVVGPPAFLYRKEVFSKIGNYEEGLMTGQDTALDIKLGMQCEIAYIDKYVYLYHKHSSSTTDKVKKQKSREFMQWPRLTQSHLPFYLAGKANNDFGRILYKKIFSSMGKMIQGTMKKDERKDLLNKLSKDTHRIKMPFLIKASLEVLVVFPSKYFLKIYLYYVLPKTLNSLNLSDVR